MYSYTENLGTINHRSGRKRFNNSYFLIFFVLCISSATCYAGETFSDTIFPGNIYTASDTLVEGQKLYNGRAWQNFYTSIEGDQFLYSKEFLPGSVTMRGRTFSNLMILYDILKDEVLIPFKPLGVLQLNREMVDSFSISFNNKSNRFVMISDSTGGLVNGFYNELYNGKVRLYARYSKKIEKFADGGKYDKFYQINRIYLLKNGVSHILTGKKDLLRAFTNDKKAIREFINKNNIRILKTDGDSYVPVLEFIDSLK